MKRWVRMTLGVVLGGAAGLSLTSSVLPTIIATLTGVEDFFVRMDIAGYAAHCVILWAIGGLGVAKVGHPPGGAAVLGVVGLASGAFLAVAALGTTPQMLAMAILGSGFYGGIGGMMLGSILRKPYEEPAAAPAAEGKGKS